MWLGLNTFVVDIDDCDIRLYKAYWNCIRDPLERGFGVQSPMCLGWLGADWTNLVQYCRFVWEGSLPRTGCDELNGLLSVVRLATHIAEQSRMLPWEQVVAQLESLRMVAGLLDSRWMH